MFLDGELQNFQLHNLLRAVLEDGEKACILVAHESQDGEILCDAGRILSARVGPREGPSALFELLGWKEGNFHVSQAWPEARISVGYSWGRLLAEAFRRAARTSEQHEVGSQPNLGNTRPVLAGSNPSQIAAESGQSIFETLELAVLRAEETAVDQKAEEHDTFLAKDLGELVRIIETRLAVLDGSGPSRSPVDGLLALCEIFNLSISFRTSRPPGPPEVDDVESYLLSFNVPVGNDELIVVSDDSIDLPTLRARHSDLASPIVARQRGLVLAQRVLEVLEHRLLELGHAFETPHHRSAWLESSHGVIAKLGRMFQKQA